MAETKIGKKPDLDQCVGKEKPDAGEAGGRRTQLEYICYNDQTTNYVACYGYFICWRCGALNWPP